ncbi:MAG: citramalate synthase, partial [Candidatus Binatia bacterium]
MATKIEIYDTTLRDGTQGEGISFTVQDKLNIATRLDECGISCIEGGWPGSNPRDVEFFTEARRLPLSSARIAAFGMTMRPGERPSADVNLRALLKAETPVVTLVAKSWDLHVREALRISKSANLDIIRDSVSYLAKRVERVILDAEHFFDGYVANPDYALACLEAAAGRYDYCVVDCPPH